jgi:hypothetical protein
MVCRALVPFGFEVFFELDHRAPGVGEPMEFLVECLAERPASFDRILVIIIINRSGQQLGAKSCQT